MQAYAKLLAVILLASAIQLTLGADGNPQSGVFVSRAFTVVSSPSDIFVSRAFTVVSSPSDIFVSRAFTVVSSPSDIFVSRAFTVVSSPSDIFVSRAFTVVNCAGSDDGLCGDCDDDGIPDQCELDCGTEGGICDVPGCGQSDDCNDNGVPDECEPDCNANGVADACDIDGGTSQDCNSNGIPDECEIDEAAGPGFFCDPADPPPPLIECDPDCNDNGIPDDCEADCDDDGIPDECVIAGCEGEPACSDCNGNGVPDECDPDCDDDDVPDECVIAECPPDTPACDDCNGNGIPDGCDLNSDDPDGNGEVSGDCDDDGVLDECEIADCEGDPDCGDCNVNEIPDGCDIADGTSQDTDDDGVPDECVVWDGGAEGDSWSTDGNWEGDDAPGDGVPEDDLESVVIAGVAANVILDIDVSIDSLLLGAGATLHIDREGKLGDMIVESGGAILVQGNLLVAHDREIDASGSSVTIGLGGVYQADPEAGGPITATLQAGSISIQGGSLEEDGGVVNVSGSMALISEGEVTIGPGGVYQADPAAKGPVSATLQAGSVTIQGGSLKDDGGALILSGSMVLISNGDLGLQSTDDGKGGCKGSGTPPDFNSTGNAGVSVSGNFVTGRCARINVNSSQALLLGGDFDNFSINPDTSTGFNWDAGELQMNGPDDQTIEAAGEDRGPCPAGFNENFVIGRLTLAENAFVIVVDEFDNQQDGTTACDEALYVGVLILEAGSELQTTSGCRVYYDELINNGGSIPGFGTDVLQVESTCADLSGDGDVGAFDLGILLGSWGPCPPEDVCPADLDGDGDVGASDLAILLGSWGPVP